MSSTESFFSALTARRSIYALSNETTIPDSRVEEIIQKVLLTTPSAFNTQTTRIVVLLRDDHRKLWDIVKTTVKPLVPAEQFSATEKKLEGFQSAYMSILFFEDPAPYEPLAGFKMYANKFGSWRDQTSGMHQLLVWTALEVEGLGANVQHYNPLIDDEVKETWGIEKDWILVSQMVVGKPVGDRPAEKEKKPVKDRYMMIG